MMSEVKSVDRLLVIITRMGSTDNVESSEWSDESWWHQGTAGKGEFGPPPLFKKFGTSAVLVIRGSADRAFPKDCRTPGAIAEKVIGCISEHCSPQKYGVLFHSGGYVLSERREADEFRKEVGKRLAGCLCCKKYSLGDELKGQESLDNVHQELAKAILAGNDAQTPFDRIWGELGRLNEIEQKLSFLHSCLGLACEASAGASVDQLWQKHQQDPLVTNARRKKLVELSPGLLAEVGDTNATSTVNDIVVTLGAGDKDIAEKFSALRALRDALLSEDDS